jgi:molybdopterin molybdotransferase
LPPPEQHLEIEQKSAIIDTSALGKRRRFLVLPYELALRSIAETVEPLEKEEIPVSEAQTCYLAEDIVAPFAIGGYDAQDVIARGCTLVTPALVSLLSATGRTKVQVCRRPRVGIVVTGEEVQPQGEPLKFGKVYDATTYVLRALLKRLGVQGIVFGMVSKRQEALKETFKNALEAMDFVLICGGGTGGENGAIRDVLFSLGVKEIFWRCAIEPGENLFFGTAQGRYVFCLPSDPVFAAIVFETVITHAVNRAKGALSLEALKFSAIFEGEKRKAERRLRFLLSRFFIEPGGQCRVWPCDTGGEYSLRAFAHANSITLFPREETTLTHGRVVEILPLLMF